MEIYISFIILTILFFLAFNKETQSQSIAILLKEAEKIKERQQLMTEENRVFLEKSKHQQIAIDILSESIAQEKFDPKEINTLKQELQSAMEYVSQSIDCVSAIDKRTSEEISKLKEIIENNSKELIREQVGEIIEREIEHNVDLDYIARESFEIIANNFDADTILTESIETQLESYISEAKDTLSELADELKEKLIGFSVEEAVKKELTSKLEQMIENIS